jgi:hypothetical protein
MQTGRKTKSFPRADEWILGCLVRCLSLKRPSLEVTSLDVVLVERSLMLKISLDGNLLQ